MGGMTINYPYTLLNNWYRDREGVIRDIIISNELQNFGAKIQLKLFKIIYYHYTLIWLHQQFNHLLTADFK